MRSSQKDNLKFGKYHSGGMGSSKYYNNSNKEQGLFARRRRPITPVRTDSSRNGNRSGENSYNNENSIEPKEFYSGVNVSNIKYN